MWLLLVWDTSWVYYTAGVNVLSDFNKVYLLRCKLQLFETDLYYARLLTGMDEQ